MLAEITAAAGEIILFIDELHNLVGAGRAEGSMDASNMLKPALARGLHCVGATTLDEYRKHIEKDAALARRFQPVLVSEPTVEDTVSILRGIKEKYEIHHGVRITDGAIVAAATCRTATSPTASCRQGDRPDGRGGGRLRMQVDSKPEQLDEVDRRIMQLRSSGWRYRRKGSGLARAAAARAGAARSRAGVGRGDRPVAGGKAEAGERTETQGGARARAPRAGQERSAGATGPRPTS